MSLKPLLTALFALACLAGCDGGSNTISGTISLSPDKQAKLGESDALFILARPAGQAGGRPVAVVRMVGMKFPVHYTLNQEDVLMPGSTLQGKVDIQALIKRSGMVGVDAPGDMSGSYPKNPVTVGDQHVDFTIDKVSK